MLGDGTEGSGTLEVLENGPDRFASRFRLGPVRQLRVVEWAASDHAYGVVEHAIELSPRLTARFEIRLVPGTRRLRVDVAYRLDTPLLGLGLSLRLGRRRSLVRRLASSWLALDDDRSWNEIRVLRGDGWPAPPTADGAED